MLKFEDIEEGTDVQNGRELLRVSTLYSNRVSFMVCDPAPPRTTVRTYTKAAAETLTVATHKSIGRYFDRLDSARAPGGDCTCHRGYPGSNHEGCCGHDDGRDPNCPQHGDGSGPHG
jgi:hypothetical protein